MQTRGFQEAIRTATVTYPIPFAFAVLLLFALLGFGGSLVAAGVLRWLLAGTATFSALSAILLFGYALLWRPDLLRSERHVLMMQISGTIGDRDMDPAARERLSYAVLEIDDRRRPKSASGEADGHDLAQREDDNG
jgi:hypothetical protein